jgi:hypothetical protein
MMENAGSLAPDGVYVFVKKVCRKASQDCMFVKQHNLIAVEKKPYRCDGCGASFAHANAHNRHARTHSGDRPYVVCASLLLPLPNIGQRGDVYVHRPTTAIFAVSVQRLPGGLYTFERAIDAHLHAHGAAALPVYIQRVRVGVRAPIQSHNTCIE